MPGEADVPLAVGGADEGPSAVVLRCDWVGRLLVGRVKLSVMLLLRESFGSVWRSRGTDWGGSFRGGCHVGPGRAIFELRGVIDDTQRS